jgi:syntaxin 8
MYTETDETRDLHADQILLNHDAIIAQQDRGLEALSGIVKSQKYIANTIGSEINRQNVMIDDMGDKMDNVNDRLINNTQKIRFVDRKSSTCGIWLLIVFLLIAIIVIAAI